MARSGGKVRIAESKDIRRMAEIYAPYVSSTPISFEREPPSVKDFSNRVTSSIDHFPWLVYEMNQRVVGYAYASDHGSRWAYRWSSEVSVYIDLEFKRQGIGRQLYLVLFSILKAQGYFNLFAGITLPNDASVGLHESLGFEKIGTYRNVGFKFNQWHDVCWYQLKIQDLDRPEAEPLSFRQVKDSSQFRLPGLTSKRIQVDKLFPAQNN